MKKFILLIMIFALPLTYAKDSEFRKKWQNAKKKAEQEYKNTQGEYTEVEKTTLNLFGDFNDLFVFNSNLGPALDNLKKVQAKELKDYDDDDDEDFKVPKKMTWKKLIAKSKKDPIYSAFRAYCIDQRAIENLNYINAIKKVDLEKLDKDSGYKKELKDIKKIWKVYVKKKAINISSSSIAGWKIWKKKKYPRVIDDGTIKQLIESTNSRVVQNINGVWSNFKKEMNKELKKQAKLKKKEFRLAKSKVLHIINKYQEHISEVALRSKWEENEIKVEFWETMDKVLETMEEDLAKQKYDNTKGRRLQ
ncbi:hypothetical protein [Candidatus Uabimicrobium sp. HlEnr_7]|uniref:hypothetical protein n=1 Tax=Candidatus Uabimicrobium helgolandensis TaxID=3095367 RepID=UPI003558AA44